VSRRIDDRYLRLVRGEARGPGAAVARCGLAGLSIAYGLAVRARNTAFDRGWIAAERAAAPVVSIGNITTGGTGKTPMVEWVARWFRGRALRVAILSRGYRRGTGEGLNDEALVLDENLPDVPHLQDPDRRAIARAAVEELESQVLVLDDGFQHRRLSRDLDVVLLDALDPFGQGWLLPRGLLREPVGSLRRAGVVVLSRADLVDAPERAAVRAAAERRAGRLIWVEARHAPLEVVGSGVAAEPLGALAGRRVAAFCGIGNPDAFERTVRPLGVELLGLRRFADHHDYRARDVAELAAWAREVRADLLLTTQKDLVKLRAAEIGGTPLRALRVGLDILDGGDLLDAVLAAVAPPP
jgi:tetraacyldisaccharide 4'-kinase